MEYPPLEIWSLADFKCKTNGSKSPDANFSLESPANITRSHLHHFTKHSTFITNKQNRHIKNTKKKHKQFSTSNSTWFWWEWVEREHSQDEFSSPWRAFLPGAVLKKIAHKFLQSFRCYACTGSWFLCQLFYTTRRQRENVSGSCCRRQVGDEAEHMGVWVCGSDGRFWWYFCMWGPRDCEWMNLRSLWYWYSA